MAMQSKVAKNQTKSTGIKVFNNLINSDLMRTKIHQMVGATDSQEFITSITSAVNTNPALAECDPQTIISAALLGQSLHLKPSPQLGYFYMVPFNNRKKGTKEAQFQLGYKGLLQLAIRTSEYIDIDAIEIKEGEYKGRDKFTGRPKFEFVEDDDIRENLPVVGYMAYFEMKNGYIKRLYWSKTKMENHADTYSMAFDLEKYHDLQEGKIPQSEQWKYSSFWYKNFDEMAKKTMLRQLLSKHGLLSTEMQKAVESDQAVITKDLQPEYVDNENVIDNAAVEKEQTQSIEENSAPTVENIVNQAQPEAVLEDIDPMQM
ncbi:recombinase RecT [Thomasclavelia ramosa]|uniref:Recombinase n=1 Tax=Thomasclavelia ramosa TaxID=1547 RepID=A0A3E3EFT8_9FIRM|nr:recombinase RecT [Thomasclavelia ramosa]RGD86716.1 recombinase [Thomasclavelia ramosa]